MYFKSQLYIICSLTNDFLKIQENKRCLLLNECLLFKPQHNCYNKNYIIISSTESIAPLCVRTGSQLQATGLVQRHNLLWYVTIVRR